MRTAAAAGLGAVRPGRTISRRLWVFGVVTFVPLAAVVLGAMAARQWWDWFWGVALAFFAALVSTEPAWLTTRVRPTSRVYEFDGGLVLTRQAETIAFAWPDIEYVERAHEHPGAMVGGYYTYSYRVRPRGGDITTEIELPKNNDRVAARTAAITIDRGREPLARGETMSFGPISVGPDRLAAQDWSLPWSEVDRVVRSSESVRVYRRDRRRIWAAVPIGDVPDARALEWLVRQASNAAPRRRR